MQAAGTKKSSAQGGLIVVLGNGENKGRNQKTGIIGGREENKTKKKVEELVGVEKKAGGQPGGDEDKQEGEPSATQSGLQVTIKGSETGSLEADEQRLEIASIGAPELRISVLTRGSGKPVKEGDLEEAEKDDVSISSDSEPMEDDDRCDEEEHVAREIIRWMHLQDKSAEEMTNSHDFVSPPLKLLALALSKSLDHHCKQHGPDSLIRDKLWNVRAVDLLALYHLGNKEWKMGISWLGPG